MEMVHIDSKQASTPRSQAAVEVASHTPAPWTTKQFDFTTVVYGPGGIQVVSTSWHGSIRSTFPLKAESLANVALIVEAVNARDGMVKRIARLEANLLECREHLETEVDVIDGSNGEPMPNRAMALVSLIDESLHGPGAF